MEKQKSHAFRKDVYLLGIDSEWIRYWLESPTWDCDWYWGFWYIETYQSNKMPDKAKDIDSHQHANDFLGKWWHSWNGSVPILSETTFSNDEGWMITELFKRFYLFQELAWFYHSGGMNCIPSQSKINKQKWEEINKITLPEIMNEIISILSPE